VAEVVAAAVLEAVVAAPVAAVVALPAVVAVAAAVAAVAAAVVVVVAAAAVAAAAGNPAVGRVAVRNDGSIGGHGAPTIASRVRPTTRSARCSRRYPAEDDSGARRYPPQLPILAASF
jgi:hypothetical protein